LGNPEHIKVPGTSRSARHLRKVKKPALLSNAGQREASFVYKLCQTAIEFRTKLLTNQTFEVVFR